MKYFNNYQNFGQNPSKPTTFALGLSIIASLILISLVT